MAATTSDTTGTTDAQLLELALGESRFAIDIRYVDEIVERKPLTPIPNSAREVAGVMDLRGQTTKIIDPKTVLDVEGTGTGDHVIILDVTEETTVGWIVDDVYQVFTPEEYDQTSMADNPSVEGIVHEGEDFIIWVDPTQVSEQTA